MYCNLYRFGTVSVGKQVTGSLNFVTLGLVNLSLQTANGFVHLNHAAIARSWFCRPAA